MKITRASAPAQRPDGPWVALRGPSGRLYGYYDPAGQIIEFKRKGEQPERIDLGAAARKPT